VLQAHPDFLHKHSGDGAHVAADAKRDMHAAAATWRFDGTRYSDGSESRGNVKATPSVAGSSGWLAVDAEECCYMIELTSIV
jgi:hypothetical protein